MPIAESFASLPAAIQWHVAAAGGALLLGPVALRARKGAARRCTAAPATCGSR